eukprot:TRINITY_DN2803_c0_g2_i5.p1 TRINITY_DN2803_c0_g2~~TRINITY_DN2803_c0_g2_i5.p1  ORF type:complete len:160 (-),score=35.45 TRINITY_DN2803_c0_g2_i5:132-611(-)
MLRSLVGSEMCIRDRVSTQSTWGILWRTMLKPKLLVGLLEKVAQTYANVRYIFISKVEGSLLAATTGIPDQRTFTATFSNIWFDYIEISKLEKPFRCGALKSAIVDYKKGKVVLATLCGDLLLGIYYDHDVDLGMMMTEVDLLKSILEPEFSSIFGMKD